MSDPGSPSPRQRHLVPNSYRVVRAIEADGDGAWRAADDDPQFLVDASPIALPGIYRFVAELEVPDDAEPCIYLDLGDGWSEQSRRSFTRSAGDNRWTCTAHLPGLYGPARFDPMQFAGRFDFRGMRIERLGDVEALLMLVGGATAVGAETQEGSQAQAARIHDAAMVLAAGGVDACLHWLAAGTGEPPAAVDPNGYATWVADFDAFADGDAATMRASLDHLPARPLVSVLLAPGNCAPRQLQATLEDLVAQWYPDWMVQVDTCGLSADASEVLAAFAAHHVRVVACAPVEGRAADGAFHGARADGAYCTVLRGCPRLAPHALLALVDALLASGGAAGAHGDHDRLDRFGRRHSPWFTPAWNPDLFRSRHYTGPLMLFDGALARAVLDGDPLPRAAVAEVFAVRCVARSGFESIVRVPLVLAHRPDADAAGDDSVPALRAAEIERAARVDGVDLHVEVVDAGCHVAWPLPAPPPRVALVIPTRDGLHLLRQCVDSILSRSTYPDYEIVIVDNQSREPETHAYFESLGDDRRVRVLAYDAPFNYSAINNFAVSRIEAPIIALVNNDIEVITPDWMEQMVQHAVRPGVGAVGAMLYYPDDTIQHAGVTLGLGGVAGHPYSRHPRGTAGQHGRALLVQDMAAVTAACLLVRRETYLAVGGLSEALAVAFNDVDFCIRLLDAGYRNLWTPLAELYHHESASRGHEDTPEKLARFQSEVERMHASWPAQLSGDAAYSPNLSLAHGDGFNLARPPRQSLRTWVRRMASRPRSGPTPTQSTPLPRPPLHGIPA